MSEAFDPRTGNAPPVQIEFDALWDTGATASVITQRVVDGCNLSPTGIAKVFTADGEHQAETYLVNIALPNGVVFSGLRVTKGDIRGIDMLIGMDVMNHGDFAVTNHGGVTKFSFRMPPQSHIDFVADTQRPQRQQRGGQGKTRPKRASRPRGKKEKKRKKKK